MASKWYLKFIYSFKDDPFANWSANSMKVENTCNMRKAPFPQRLISLSSGCHALYFRFFFAKWLANWRSSLRHRLATVRAGFFFMSGRVDGRSF